jgi:peptidoglycan/LPS O-acetylase OafA/YrhL
LSQWPFLRDPTIRPATTLDSLTTVRFLAAFNVVVFHFGGDAIAHLPRPAQLIFERGYVSVSFFFVLSGFILAYTYLNGENPSSSSDFYRARFARVYPVYVLGFLLEAVFVWQEIAQTHATPAAIGITLLTGSVTLLLLQSWIITLVPEWNPPSWSLSTEAFFYAIFPFAGRAVFRLSRPRLKIACLLLGALVFTPCLVDLSWFQGQPTAHQLDLLGCSPLLRSLEFLLGVLLGRIFLLDPPRSGGNGILLGATAAMIALLCGSSAQPLELWREKSLVLVFATLIYGLASSKGRVRACLSFRPLVLLGQASYALYILHWPLHNIALAIRALLFRTRWEDPHPGTGFFILYLTAVVGVSILVLVYIETPARQYLREVRPRSGRHLPIAGKRQ